MFGPAFASGLEKTIPECPRWLAEADDFLDQCKINARQFTTTFYPSGGSRGEQEKHSVWFASAPANQHFLMGCTLRSNNSLSFLGIYYTAEPSSIEVANLAPIMGVGFDGDVTLLLDSHPVTFVAVRPFETSRVKTRWSGSREVFTNCLDPLGEDGAYHILLQSISADFSRFERDHIVEEGLFPGSVQTTEYKEFFPSDMRPQLIYSWYGVVLITSSGSLLVKKDSFPKICFDGNPQRVAQSPLLLHQLCKLPMPYQK